jgi:hypothetical protein
VVACVATAVLCACDLGSPHEATATVTVRATVPPGASADAIPDLSPSAAAHLTQLPGDCDTLLAPYEVEHAAGIQLPGNVAFVVGLPERNIGRLAYLNCRYGIMLAGGPPSVEIGTSLYDSAAQAQARLNGTIDDYLSHGATQTTTRVGALAATVFTGGNAGYDVPLLVLAAGQRTVAVSVATALVPAARLRPVMASIALLAVEQTG